MYGETFFYLLDYVTRRSVTLGFQQQKKRKKKRILPDTTTKLLVFGIIRNHRENNYFKILLSFGKQCKSYDKWGLFLRSPI